MQYGFTLPGRGPLATPDNLATIARRGEELGYHFVLFGDHIVVPKQITSPYPYTETGEFPGSASGVAAEIVNGGDLVLVDGKLRWTF